MKFPATEKSVEEIWSKKDILANKYEFLKYLFISIILMAIIAFLFGDRFSMKVAYRVD